MATIAKAMACPESGLEVRDRMWLKITIANAFIGTSVGAEGTVWLSVVLRVLFMRLNYLSSGFLFYVYTVSVVEEPKPSRHILYSKCASVFSSGSDVVDWLFHHVEGFSDRREARKYASNLLKAGYIRHTVNKITFSEQCYYIFGDLCGSKWTLES